MVKIIGHYLFGLFCMAAVAYYAGVQNTLLVALWSVATGANMGAAVTFAFLREPPKGWGDDAQG